MKARPFKAPTIIPAANDPLRQMADNIIRTGEPAMRQMLERDTERLQRLAKLAYYGLCLVCLFAVVVAAARG